MTEQHPISPPPELVQELSDGFCKARAASVVAAVAWTQTITSAAQWGWDQRAPEIQAAVDAELEACCEWLRTGPYGASIACYSKQIISDLRAARRPKPLSLKEQALLQLDTLNADLAMDGVHLDLSQIRRALELLPDNPTTPPSNP
jgi:hypothetical protein